MAEQRRRHFLPTAVGTHTYATRVFVEDLGILQFSYYDYLFASISGSSKPAK